MNLRYLQFRNNYKIKENNKNSSFYTTTVTINKLSEEEVSKRIRNIINYYNTS